MNLAWIDIETTGLDETKGVILEIGLVITRPDLTEIGRASWVITDAPHDPRELMDPFVFQMHTRNGLLRETEGGKAVTIREAEDELVALLHEHDALGGPMCGSSAHFDRKWLDEHSNVAKAFSHRNIDVSSFKEYLKAIGHEFEKAEPAHRAVDDCLASISELRKIRDRFGLELPPPEMAA